MERRKTLTSDLDKTIVRAVRAEMARQGISQETLGTRIGWDQRRVSRRLTGEVPLSVSELAQIAEALGIRTADLMVPGPAGPGGPRCTPGPPRWHAAALGADPARHADPAQMTRRASATADLRAPG